MNEQTFENNLLETCNKVAHMMYTESQRINNGVSEISKEEAFEMAKKLTFATYNHILGIN